MKPQRGYILLFTMVIIALAIAAAVVYFIVIPTVLVKTIDPTSVLDRAKLQQQKRSVSEVQISLTLYKEENHSYPQILQDLADKGLVREKWLTDPITEKPYDYRSEDAGQSYALCTTIHLKGYICFSPTQTIDQIMPDK